MEMLLNISWDIMRFSSRFQFCMQLWQKRIIIDFLAQCKPYLNVIINIQVYILHTTILQIIPVYADVGFRTLDFNHGNIYPKKVFIIIILLCCIVLTQWKLLESFGHFVLTLVYILLKVVAWDTWLIVNAKTIHHHHQYHLNIFVV